MLDGRGVLVLMCYDVPRMWGCFLRIASSRFHFSYPAFKAWGFFIRRQIGDDKG